MPPISSDPLSLEFYGARVLLPDGLQTAPLSISDGRVVSGGGRPIDLTGFLILPGIVDLHGDGFERHLAPRRGALESLSAGLTALDAELAANGITSAFLAQFYSWEGGMRGPDFAEALVEALATFASYTDLSVQLRLETHLLDDYPRALDLIERAGIGYVVFNDHLPHSALSQGKRPPSLTGQALKSGRSPEAHWALLRALHANDPAVRDALATLAQTLSDRGVRLGTHDDHTAEGRAFGRRIGARIAEFPETRAAAEAAKTAGDSVIMGAPNVVRGGSHKGKISARDLVMDGMVDALVSDYHYPSLARAAFALEAAGVSLPMAWALVSTGPSRIMALDDRGHLAPGTRADLVIVDDASRRICGTIAEGVVSYASGPFAHRLLGATP